MKKLSFRSLITFSLIIANIVFFSLLYIIFNNFYLNNTKKKFMDENTYSLKIANDFLANELKDLEKLSKQIANNDRVRYALVLKKQLQVQLEFLSNTDTNNYKLSDINLFGYKKLATGIKGTILSDRGASEDISRRDVEFYDSTFKRIADTAMKRNTPMKQNILDEFYKSNQLGVSASVGSVDFLDNNFVFRGASDVGSNHQQTYFGAIAVKEIFDGITLDEIKKITNKELIVIRDNKIILSTLFKGTERIVDVNIDPNFTKLLNGFPLSIDKRQLIFNLSPLLDFNNKVIGYIGVGFSQDDMMTIFKESSKNIILYFFIFTVLLAIIISFILAILFKPFNKIILGIKRFGDGDYNEKINTRAVGELNTLVININDLASAVQSRELELTEKNKELLEMDKLKDQFLANTSHELRTPLNGIIGLSESLIDGISGKLPKEAVFNLNLIITSGKRLLNLINDILDFSKMKNQELVVQLTPVNIKQLTDNVILMTRTLISTKDLKVENWINSAFPLVKGDINRLQQILYNLIGNGIKFSENGTVRVTAEVKDNLAHISVSDTGIGISEENFSKLFSSFEQLEDSDTRQYGGTGLGLSISKKLVEIQGGTISFQSEINKGSIFTFSIPISDNQTKKEKSEIIETDFEDSSKQLSDLFDDNSLFIDHQNKIKVLVVDDEIINLQVMVNHLKNQDIVSDIATNGYDALKKIEKYSYDVVVLDIMMPKMSGYEVCKAIRAKYTASEIPILMLTAKNRPEDIVVGFDAGANDYVVKPFEKRELLARIKTLANLKRAVEESIVSAQLYEVEKQQKEISEKLRAINNELTAALDLRKVTEKLLIELSRVIHYDQAFALLKTDGFYEVFSYEGLKEHSEVTTRKFTEKEDSIIFQIFHEKKPILISDLDHSLSGFSNININGMVGIPVTYRQDTIGAIILESNTKDFYNNSTLDLIMTIAGQAGIAIENAKLFSKLAENIEKLKSIQQMVSVIYTEKDVKKAISSLLALLVSKMGINYEKVVFLEYSVQDESLLMDKNTSVSYRFYNSSNKFSENIKLSRLETSFANTAFYTNQILFSDEIAKDNLELDFVYTSLKMNSFCIIPVISENIKYGIIILEPLDIQDMTKTKNEIENLQLFAKLLSIYLDNRN